MLVSGHCHASTHVHPVDNGGGSEVTGNELSEENPGRITCVPGLSGGSGARESDSPIPPRRRSIEASSWSGVVSLIGGDGDSEGGRVAGSFASAVRSSSSSSMDIPTG